MADWLKAEKLYWTSLNGRYPNGLTSHGKNVTGRVYGTAAGQCPRQGYCVTSILNTKYNDDTYSFAVMTGFLGAVTGNLRKELNDDIQWLWDNDVCMIKKKYPDETGIPDGKIGWRCSVAKGYENWQSSGATGVDYGTTVMGYGSNFMRQDFFDLYSL